MQDNWQLYNGFVAAEAKSLLPHISNNRLNFTDNYIALLLYSLISNGLLESLVSIIITPDNLFNSVRATILLGELLHLTNQYLPPEMSQVCQSLPQLMNACISDKLTIKQKTIANTAVSCLNKMHSLKKKPMTPGSLFLDLLLQFSNPSFRSSLYDLQLNKWKVKDVYYKLKENEENSIVNAIGASQVLRKDVSAWDWSLIGFLLKVPSDYMKKVEENTHVFLSRLITFFKPTSKQFSSIDHNDSNAKEIALAGLYLIDFLMECDEKKSAEFIDDLMTDLNLCLSQISIVDSQPSANCIFGPGKMLSTLSSYYFLYLGKLSSTNKGRKLLEKSGIYQYLVNLIASSTHDVYIKLIISSLDYNQENFSRKLLSQALICKSDSARLYATNFLRVLLCTEMKDFHKWVIELLVQQLNNDENQSVCLSAIEILDEACDKLENLNELISLRPNLLHLNDKGILLFSRFASCKNGFNYLQDTNLLNYELERWSKTFCLKYVNIVEEILNETFTYHQKSEDGSYGRRMDKRHFMVKKNAYLPPHLYGQLAICEDGCKLIANESIIPNLIGKIKKIISFDMKSSIDMKMHCSELIDYKELTILQLKAALWACSHIASTELGLQLVRETDFIQIVAKLASNSQLLSIRATAFYCLGLISSTENGSALLFECDWIALRHNRQEKWPIYKEMIEKNEVFSYPFKQLANREYASSISSVGKRATDANLSGVNKPSSSIIHNSTSGLLNDSSTSTRSDDEQVLSKSLSHIENEKHKSSFIKLEQLDENFTNGNSTLSAGKLQNSSNQVRPRSSSDCQQKVSFNLQDRKSATNNRLDDCSNSTICNLATSCNSTQPSLTNVNSSSKKTNSIDQIEHHQHYLESNHNSQPHLSQHLANSDQGSSDQLTSPVSLGDVEYGHSKLNATYDTKNMYLPSSIIEENSTFDVAKDTTSASFYHRPLQYSHSTRKSRPSLLSNSMHSGSHRESYEHTSTGSIDFKTLHMRMIKHSSATNISHLKQKIVDSNTAINIDEDNLHNKAVHSNVHHSTSYPESIKSSHSFEYSLPATHHSSREVFRKLSQISNPHSFERNYSLYINTCLTEHGDPLDDCDFLQGLQDDPFEIVMPDTEDTIGYAALKSLQHKKEKTNQLLMFNNQFSCLKEDILQNKEQAKSKLYKLNGDDDELTKEFTNGFKLSSAAGKTDDFRIRSEIYMNICLPDNLSLIFDLEVSDIVGFFINITNLNRFFPITQSNKNSIRNQQRFNNLQRRILDEKYSVVPKTDVDVHLGFKFHSRSSCLLDDEHKVVNLEPNPDKPKKDKDRRTISVTECRFIDEIDF